MQGFFASSEATPYLVLFLLVGMAVRIGRHPCTVFGCLAMICAQ
jgi:hypothetical protein